MLERILLAFDFLRDGPGFAFDSVETEALSFVKLAGVVEDDDAVDDWARLARKLDVSALSVFRRGFVGLW